MMIINKGTKINVLCVYLFLKFKSSKRMKKKNYEYYLKLLVDTHNIRILYYNAI